MTSKSYPEVEQALNSLAKFIYLPIFLENPAMKTEMSPIDFDQVA